MCSTGLRQNISGYFFFCTWSNPGINNCRRNVRAELGTRLETLPIVHYRLFVVFSRLSRGRRGKVIRSKIELFVTFCDSFSKNFSNDEKWYWREDQSIAIELYRAVIFHLGLWSAWKTKIDIREGIYLLVVDESYRKEWWAHATAIIETVTFSLRISRPD